MRNREISRFGRAIFAPSFLFLFAVLAFFPARSFSQPLSHPRDVRILEQNSAGVRFIFSPEKLERESVSLSGKTYVSVRFQGASVASRPGEPEIPVRTLVFAVPPGAKVQFQVLGVREEKWPDVRLIAVPFWKENTSPPVPEYPDVARLPDPQSWFPGEWVKVEAPAMLGDLRVVRVHLFPVRYLASRKTVRVARSMEVRLRFAGPAGNTGSRRIPYRPEQEPFYRKTVLNFESAQSWLQAAKPPLRRPRRYWLGGTYYKIAVDHDGIYRITGKFLKDHGVDISSIDPATIKIFNNGGRPLPLSLNEPRPDSLIENAILVRGVSDGRFDEADEIIFYGRGTSGWNYSSGKFRHEINPYTYSNIYWLTFNDGVAGKRMQSFGQTFAPAKRTTTFTDLRYFEDELRTLFGSGRVWFGPEFNQQGEKTYLVDFLSPTDSSEVTLSARVYGASRGTRHSFQFLLDGQVVGELSFSDTALKTVTFTKKLRLNAKSQNLTVRYQGSSPLSYAYLDWVEVQATCNLVLNDGKLDFYAPVGDWLAQFALEGAAGGENYLVLDVTDFANVVQITNARVDAGRLLFESWLSSDRPKQFFVCSEKKIIDVNNLMQDEPSDLHNPSNGADFLIITHENFLSAANALKNLRESHDGLATTVVKISDVYDEFSGGVFDPTAIRDFLHYVFFNWQKRPTYVLLFGDGDYDYRNILSKGDSNWIPPFETTELDEINNRTTDDWFTYVSGADRIADYSIGRIPVQTTAEAENVVDKLTEYAAGEGAGPWHNLITIVADDELVEGGRGNEIIHTYDAEDLAENYVPRRFDLQKIYLTEYPVVYDAAAGGLRKPAAAEALMNRINEGTLILNFIGHGNPHLWTHERILLDSRDEPKINNPLRYAFWVTATCDFGRFDDPTEQSFAEKLLVMQERGAVGLLASARLVYATSNAFFNKEFFRYLFRNPADPERVADAMRLAKISTYNVVNNEKFHILGDPTLKLAVPRLNVHITGLSPDSLKALSEVHVQGTVLLEDGQPYPGNGELFAKAFDSRRKVTYVTKAGSKLQYLLPGRPIFRGSGTVENGRFEIRFIVPKDITYGGDLGRISLYFSADGKEGAGYRDSLIVDGTETDFVDTKGPDIFFEAHNQEIVDYALLRQDDLLHIVLQDDRSGINITGEVGHKIVVTPDDNPINQKDVTHLFEYEPNSYLKGALDLPLSLFPAFATREALGRLHTLTVKGWDNANNSASRTLQFELVSKGKLLLKDVLNVPNPFAGSTHFTFYLNDDAEVEIRVYTLSGRLLLRLEGITGVFGFNAVAWNGRDEDGDELANGVYLYKVIAKKGDQRTEAIGKLIKMR